MLRLLTALLLAFIAGSAATADEWAPVRETSLEVAPGSPLDFSILMPNRPIEAANRLVIAPGGYFAAADTPDRQERLLCASLGWSPASGGFPDHDAADRYARQLAVHGYNIARFHFVDASLMLSRNGDFDFDRETLDRFFYLLAALKREGISWIFDGLTSWRGGFGGFDDRWDPSDDLKLSVMIEDDGFVHWQDLQEKLYGAINPYTGVSPLADPALALLVLVNEGGVEFDSIVRERPGEPHYSPKLQPGFAAWLKTRYADTEELANAWGGLTPGERLETGAIDLPSNRYEDSARLRVLQAYFTFLETAATARMSAALRALGYRGAISNFNNWPSVQASQSRGNLDAVTMNTYFDWVAGYFPGAEVTHQSSFAAALDYLRAAAATRWLGKPFLLTEYDHLFWSRTRYEAGLAMPAYAALQGWDGLCRHGHGPIALRYGEDPPHKRQMLPYAIALDPVARAGETVAALLFRRGDVAASPHRLPFVITGPNDLGPDMQAREPDDLTRLALLTGIGLSWQSEIERPAFAVQQPRHEQSLNAVLERLRAAGTLPKAEGNALHSDTGQITLAPDQQQMTVVTRNTEAAAFDHLRRPLTLGALTLQHSDGPALFAVSALDGRPVAESRRLLAIFATDARNSDMRFSDTDARVIADFGHLPVLIRQASLRFALPGSGRWTLSPVGLDGVVHAAVASGEGPIETDLSNVGPDGPTTYFLIERFD